METLQPLQPVLDDLRLVAEVANTPEQILEISDDVAAAFIAEGQLGQAEVINFEAAQLYFQAVKSLAA